MGSNPSANPVPSSRLTLALPTAAERTATWNATHSQWGAALDRETYVKREAFLTTVPMSRNGGMTQWILTTTDGEPDSRPVLSSCESIRKRCLVATPPSGVAAGADSDPGSTNWQVYEAVSHGIASVFTVPEHRGNGYASKMMALLGPQLEKWQGRSLSEGAGVMKSDSPHDEGEASRGQRTPSSTPQQQQQQKVNAGTTATTGSPGGGTGDGDRPVAFSVLFSDIGKSFYAKNGWPPFESSHLAFHPSPSKASSGEASWDENLKPISYHDLPELCTVDEQLLRRRMARPSASASSSSPSNGHANGTSTSIETAKARVALVPDLDAILWHLLREDFMTNHIFGRTPNVRGAVFQEADAPRIWAVWSRGYYGRLGAPEVGNTLHILRLVVDNDDGEDGVDAAYIARAVRAIIAKAREEAAEWRVNEVDVWNPSDAVKRAVEKAGVPCEFVEREKVSIASLMWYGKGGVEWVANEKFGWC